MPLRIHEWDGEELHVHHDQPTGAWIAIAIHSTSRGQAIGGTRWRQYTAFDDALADVFRLSRGMTLKATVAGMPSGGGKAVIALPPTTGKARVGLLERYGDLIERLDGRFATGPDIGTVESDMDVIGRRTAHVFCRTVANGGSGSPSPWTAAGVLAGIRASLHQAMGSRALTDRTVLIQGAGEVGTILARLLAAAGARILVSDVDAGRVAGLVKTLPGASVVDPEAAMTTACDVFAPCAVGAILDARTIPRLRCRVVAGSANNQLANESDAELLRSRGILYAPDFVINSGGLIRGVGAERLGWSDERIHERIEAIGDTLAEIYRDAEAAGISTHAAAMNRAETAQLWRDTTAGSAGR